MVEWLAALLSYFRSGYSRGKCPPEGSQSNFPTSPPASSWQLWDVGCTNEEQQQPTMSAFSLSVLWQISGFWKEGGNGGKDGEPRAGLLRLNKCRCRALCELHLLHRAFFYCLRVHVWETFFSSPWFMQWVYCCFSLSASHSHTEAAQSTTATVCEWETPSHW